MKIRQYFEPNSNENATYQNLWDTAKAELRNVVPQIHILVKEKAWKLMSWALISRRWKKNSKFQPKRIEKWNNKGKNRNQWNKSKDINREVQENQNLVLWKD